MVRLLEVGENWQSITSCGSFYFKGPHALQDPVSRGMIFLIVVAAIVPYVLYFWLFSR